MREFANGQARKPKREQAEAGANSLFVTAGPDSLDRFRQTAANVDISLTVWPHLTLEDYERFFELERNHKERFHRKLSQGQEKDLSPRELAAHHLGKASVLLEIVDERAPDTGGLSRFWQEYYRLSMAAEAVTPAEPAGDPGLVIPG